MISAKKKVIQSEKDNRLVQLAKDGDKSSLTELLSNYSDMVSAKAASFKSLVGLESDDLYQEGMIGLLSAVYAYDFERDASFSTFAELLVTRKMFSALKSANSKKNLPLREYVPIEDEIDLFSPIPTPEESLIINEEVSNINKFIETNLSKKEKKVLKLNLLGLSYAEIAEILDCTEKSVDNALQRIRKKFYDFK